mmetsp:Transcript_10318/g.20632  ORF Transcript_10318/g.20632 Transcript_10318/m.20632 type:complete len:268 (-) Transcript_10318:777-1580(-)
MENSIAPQQTAESSKEKHYSRKFSQDTDRALADAILPFLVRIGEQPVKGKFLGQRKHVSTCVLGPIVGTHDTNVKAISTNHQDHFSQCSYQLMLANQKLNPATTGVIANESNEITCATDGGNAKRTGCVDVQQKTRNRATLHFHTVRDLCHHFAHHAPSALSVSQVSFRRETVLGKVTLHSMYVTLIAMPQTIVYQGVVCRSLRERTEVLIDLRERSMLSRREHDVISEIIQSRKAHVTCKNRGKRKEPQTVVMIESDDSTSGSDEH